MSEQIAVIRKASLEIKERNILNFWIQVEYDNGGCQGVGGIALDEYNKKLNKRIGTAYGCEMIRQLLLILNVNELSEATDQIIKVIGEGNGLSFQPKGIKQLSFHGGKELIFDDVFNNMTKEEPF